MSSKHDILTREEVDKSPLCSAFIDLLKRYSESHNLDWQSLRVLDWGCGRGKTVIQLLELGVNAYSVDIDPNSISNGFPLMRELGHDPEKRLILIKSDCKTPFADEFFHIVLSDQVFEHVSDITALFTELSRITCLEGEGLHLFPAQYCVMEPHLLIPCVHWLPKNRLRYWWIKLMLNKIPMWEGLENKSVSERVDTYYKYSLHKTYYRPLSHIKSQLISQKFDVNFYPSNTSSRRHKLLFSFLKINNTLTFKFWNLYINTFSSVVLATKRK